jgi:hypothetical protein
MRPPNTLTAAFIAAVLVLLTLEPASPAAD